MTASPLPPPAPAEDRLGAGALVDDPARRRLAEDLDTTFVVDAGAGTGKTHALVTRVVALVAHGRVRMGALAAITFTEAAAAELRDRIRGGLDRASEDPELTEAARDRCRMASAEIDAAAIQTIHAFCALLIRTFPIEAGLPPGYRTWDTLEEDRSFDEAFRAWVRDDARPGTPAGDDLLHALHLGLRPDLLPDLAARLAREPDHGGGDHPRVASRDDQPVPDPLVSARSVLDAFDAIDDFLVHALDGESDRLVMHVRALDPSRQALAEACAREDRNGVVAVLARLVALKVRSRFGQKPRWHDPRRGVPPLEATRATLSTIATTCEDDVKAIRSQALGRVLDHLLEFVGREFRRRRSLGVATFQDLLVRARNLLRDDPDVRVRAHARWQRLFVDEFQDTDPLQAEIAWFLAADPEQAAERDWRQLRVVRGHLFVVGDPKQSIYRFRRADIAAYDEVYDVLAPRSGGARVRLVQNFRSVAPILDWVNDEFGAAIVPESGVQAEYLQLEARHPAGAAGSTANPAGPYRFGDAIDGPVAECRYQAALDLGRAIAQMVAEAWSVRDPETGIPRPVRHADICVLLPVRTGLAAIERGLQASGVPYRGVGGALVAFSAEVRDLIACLRAIHDPTDQVAVVGALRSAAYACRDDALVSWVDHGRDFDHAQDLEGAPEGPVRDALLSLNALRDARTGRSAAVTVEHLVRERMLATGTFLHRQPREAWRRVRLVIAQARVLADSGLPTLRDLIEWFDSFEAGRADAPAQPVEGDEDAVRLMTVHGSKGLEFPVVFLTGLDGRVPSGADQAEVLLDRETGMIEAKCGVLGTAGHETVSSREARVLKAERIRLEYVAATRARDYLVLLLHRKATKTLGSSPTAARRIAHRLDGKAPEDLTVRPFPLRAVALPDIPGPDRLRVIGPGTPVADYLEAEQAWETARHGAIARAATRRVVTPSSLRAVLLPSPAAARGACGQWKGARTRITMASFPPWSPSDEDADDWTDLARETSGGHATDSSEPIDSRVVAQRRGTAVHRVIELMDLADPGNLMELALVAARDVRCPGEEERIAAMASRAARSPAIRSTTTGGRTWRELALGARLGGDGPEGFVVSGLIDLVHEASDGTFHVFDVKTDAVRDAADARRVAREYEAQGGAYALALGALLPGRRVTSVTFVFVAPDDGPFDVTYAGEAVPRLEEVARARALDRLSPATTQRGRDRVRG